MKPSIRMGLIAGAVGLFLNIGISFVFGFCGPLFAAVIGAVAGFLGVQAEKPPKSEAARTGAIAGAVAGALMIVGQIIGGVVALTFLSQTGTQLPFGAQLNQSDPASMVGFYGGGLVTGLCFGIVGAGLAAGAGALTGLLAAPSEQIAPPPPLT